MDNVITRAETMLIALALLQKGNPYIDRSVCFQVDREDRFIFRDKVCTRQELDKAYCGTAMHDIAAGYRDRSAGYYDKWYRYKRIDQGRAYDAGVTFAAKSDETAEEVVFINAG